MQFELVELSGELKPGRLSAPVAPNLVVLSNLARGGSESHSRISLSLKYVAKGVEVYRYGGKTYSVTAGQFLAVPPQNSGEVEISRSAGDRTRGMCVMLARTDGNGQGLDAPMLFPAQCSELGRLLINSHSEMLKRPHHRIGTASALIQAANRNFEPLLEETFSHLTGIEATRPATRYELLRKLNLARSYRHSVVDRAVPLPELAQVAGVSQFHLLRNFRSCFGLSPSGYHRRIRLEAGKRSIDRDEMTCAEAAHRFGFADSSTFSHAYRRIFGVAPTEDKRASGFSRS